MNKSELVAAAAQKTGLSKKNTEQVIDAVMEAIAASLAEGDKVQLVGFGMFDIKTRAERTGRNPRTNETIVIPEAKLPVFKPGKALKDAVAK